MQVDPAVRHQVERRLREQGAVRHHRAGVGAQRSELLLEVRVARVLGLEDGYAELLRTLGDRAGDQLATPAARGVGSGDDADELVAAVGDRVERGHGDLGRAGEDDAHQLGTFIGRIRSSGGG